MSERKAIVELAERDLEHVAAGKDGDGGGIDVGGIADLVGSALGGASGGSGRSGRSRRPSRGGRRSSRR
jgi:hypothetical protein